MILTVSKNTESLKSCKELIPKLDSLEVSPPQKFCCHSKSLDSDEQATQARISEYSEIEKFYTINLPSINKTIYPKLCTDSKRSSDFHECASTGVYKLSLKPSDHSCSMLPPRLQGKVPKLNAGKSLEQKQDWISLKESFKSTFLTNDRAQESRRNIIENGKLAPYSISKCSSPGCDQEIPHSMCKEHLNLCDKHEKDLEAVLEEYRRIHNIELPKYLWDDKTHQMIYNSLLPSIDQLIRDLSNSTGKYEKYLTQLLMAFKACIYLYRMHLNSWSDFINTIIGLFLKALGQSERAIRKFVNLILKIVLVPFYIFGIFITWTADLLLSDDEYLGYGLVFHGIGLAAWGGGALFAATAVPIAALAGGAFLFATGVSMLWKRYNRGRPHEYCVRAQIMLNEVDAYLQQWLCDAMQNPFE